MAKNRFRNLYTSVVEYENPKLRCLKLTNNKRKNFLKKNHANIHDS